jgi:hypothetical protein
MRVLWAAAGLLVVLNMGVGLITAVIPSELNSSRPAWSHQTPPKLLRSGATQSRCSICRLVHAPGECPDRFDAVR